MVSQKNIAIYTEISGHVQLKIGLNSLYPLKHTPLNISVFFFPFT